MVSGHNFRQFDGLKPNAMLLLIGWRDMYRQQMAQPIDGHMNLCAIATLVAVVTCARTAFAT